ncbi:MAG: thioredoxin [Bacteroidales bacterium]|jgi:thioredoxin|nr:thioredoxin [Bacteroidales bacterium]
MNFVTIFIALCISACSANPNATTESASSASAVQKATIISQDEFKNLVMNYEANPEQWIFKGKRPCIVDFYADWCGPCRKVAPILDELARNYAGKIDIYKVNVDKAPQLAAYFGVRSIPTMLFVPIDGKPALQPGAMDKQTLVQIIEEFVLKPKE